MRFSYSFTKWIWQHLPKRILALKETSVWARVLKTLGIPLPNVLIGMANELYDAPFLRTAVGDSLDKHGESYRVRRNPGETDPDYRARLISVRQSRRSGAVKGTLKALAYVYLGVIPEIIEALTNDGNAFTVGETVIAPDENNPPIFWALNVAAALPHDALYLAFVYWIVLPDLSAQSGVQRSEFVRAIERANYGGNEPIIFEKREKITAFQVGISEIGINTYILPRLIPEVYKTERYN